MPTTGRTRCSPQPSRRSSSGRSSPRCERASDADGYLYPAGIQVLASPFFLYVVALSVLLQIFVLPVAAALTKRHDKGVLLGTLSTLGAGATIGMYTIGEASYALGGTLYVGATMALGASIAVANTYLPILAAPEHRDRTSTYASAVRMNTAPKNCS